jgi:hypothetical protein
VNRLLRAAALCAACAGCARPAPPAHLTARSAAAAAPVPGRMHARDPKLHGASAAISSEYDKASALALMFVSRPDVTGEALMRLRGLQADAAVALTRLGRRLHYGIARRADYDAARQAVAALSDFVTAQGN